MSEKNKNAASARNPIAATVFSLINIMLFPVMLIGYVFYVADQA